LSVSLEEFKQKLQKINVHGTWQTTHNAEGFTPQGARENAFEWVQGSRRVKVFKGENSAAMVRVLITCGGTTLDKSQHTGLEKRTRKSRRSSGANRGGNLDGTVRVTKTGNFKSNKISVNVNAYPDPNQPHLDKFLDNPAAFKDIILGINETDGREWQAPYDPAENKCHYMSRSTDNYRTHYYPIYRRNQTRISTIATTIHSVHEKTTHRTGKNKNRAENWKPAHSSTGLYGRLTTNGHINKRDGNTS